MNFDGASSMKPTRPPNIIRAQAGIGFIFIATKGAIMRFSFSFTKPRTNNEAKYKALIAGLEIITNVKI